MSEAYEYGEDDFEEEYEDDGNDDIRAEIMEAEMNEVWLEEPADEDDDLPQSMNPLFGLLSAGNGIPGIFPKPIQDDKVNNENSEQ